MTGMRRKLDLLFATAGASMFLLTIGCGGGPPELESEAPRQEVEGASDAGNETVEAGGATSPEQAPTRPTAGASGGVGAPLKHIQWAHDVHPDWKVIRAEQARVKDLLLAEDFAALETLAAERRTAKPDHISGDSALYRFYRDIDLGLALASGEQEERNLKLLTEWQQEIPDSITARTALIRLCVARAWSASRAGAGMDVVEEYLRRGWEVYEAASVEGLVDSMTYASQLDVARGLGFPLAPRRMLLERGVALEPGNQELFRCYILAFFPRWYGSPREYVAECDRVAGTSGDPEADELYARMAHLALKESAAERLKQDYPFDQERVRRGYRHALASHPLSNYISEECREISAAYGDVAMQDELIRHVAQQASVDLEEAGRWDLWVGEKRDPDRALHAAVKHRDAPMAVVLLRLGADPDAADAEGMTALSRALELGDEHMAEILEQGGADRAKAEAHQPMTLARAARAADLAEVERLLGEGADVKGEPGERTPLHNAVNSKDLDAVKALLKAGADPNQISEGKHTAGMAAAWNGDVQMLTLLLDHGLKLDGVAPSGYTLLLSAANSNHTEAVRFLISRGADVDQPGGPDVGGGDTPLNRAAYRGFAETARLLLDAGADPDQSQGADSPLHFAVAQGHLEIMKLLAGQGAEVNRRSAPQGMTPLHVAALENQIEAVEWLLDQPGIEIDAAVNGPGHTPLIFAASQGHTAVVELLLRRGADATLANGLGWTALHVATREGHRETAALLEQGAEPLIRIPPE